VSTSSALGARAGWVYLVGAGPGDPGLLTLRAAELLHGADLVLHDELVDPAVLARARGTVASVGKRGSAAGQKAAAQEAINARIVAEAKAGRSVVRLKGGDPFLFGRGSEEASALRAAGVPFEVVPGVPSPVGATAYAGIPLTHRDLASSFTCVTAVRRDGAPFDWAELRGVRGTICVFMGAHKLDAICRGLCEAAGRAPSTPAAVVQWVSYPRQQTVAGTLADVALRAAAAGIGSPSLLVVGEVVALREPLRWYDAQPLFGKRILVTRPEQQQDVAVRLLRQRGAEGVSFPTIAIEPPPDAAAVSAAVRDLGGYDLVAFTSDNGVDWLFREIDRQGKDARAFGAARLAAIGPATAAGLARRGLRPDVVAETFVAEDLARVVVAALGAEPKRVLLARALVARNAFPDALRAAGHTVDVVAVYRTVTAGAERRDELGALLPSLDAVLLTSSSTAENLCAVLGHGAAAALDHLVVASIGPVTTATATKLGLRVAVTATVSTVPGLVDALEAFSAASASPRPRP
jgi:uroporphyrinogen III methyltransferase / synthase